MDEAAVRRLIEQVKAGLVETEEVVARLRRLPYADLGFARVDHHRALRQGLAEAVYGPGKTPEQCAAIVAELLAVPGGGPVLLTRASDAQAAAALAANPYGQRHGATLVWRPVAELRPENVVVAAAGTADLPVADECAVVLAAHGFDPGRLNDVGVAGVHRLLASTDELAKADAVVVVAGMEGALASLIGGITALLAMLSSCAAGVTVVGIDNGFGAAYALLRMLGPAGPAAGGPA